MAKLLTPGPVEVPERVLAAASRRMISHRGPEFRVLLEEATTRLAELGDAEEALVLAGTGTTAVDALAWSLIPRGARVLALVWGEFGERFAASARARGALVEAMHYPWGSAPRVEEAQQVIEDGGYDYVLVVHNETSTGLAYRDIEGLARAAERGGARLLVDTVSGFPVEGLQLGKGVYAAATASHKALAAPPGAAIVLLSREAVEDLARRGDRGDDVPPVLDLVRYHWFRENRMETPFTPPIPVVYALLEALRLIEERGLERVRMEHLEKASRLYNKLPRHGYEPLVGEPRYRSATVAAFRVPGCLDALAVKKAVLEKGYVIATGMGELKKSVVRIGVMGETSLRDVDEVVGVLASLAENCRG